MRENVAFCDNLSYPMSRQQETEDISEYIQRILKEKALSEAQAAKNSGGRIKPSAINDLKNKRVLGENASISTLYYLAIGLDEPPVIVFAKALKIPPGKIGIEGMIPNELISAIIFFFSHLSDNHKQDLLDIAQVLFSQEKKLSSKATTSKGKASFSVEVTKEDFFNESPDEE